MKETQEAQETKQVVELKLTEEDVNYYLHLLSLFLIDDSRLIPLQTHLVKIIEKRNETSKK